MSNFKNLRQNLHESMIPSAPIYDVVPCIQNLPVNTENVNRREEMIPLCASPSLDTKRKLQIEAEIKKAHLRKEQLMKERQIMEEEFKAKEMLINAECELVITSLDGAGVESSPLNNTVSNVNQSDNKLVNSLTAQNQVLEVQQPTLNVNRIERPVEIPTPIGLEQLSVLDYVSIRQLVSNAVDESYEVVAPGNVVILRANLSFEMANMVSLGRRKTIRVNMFDSEVNELVNLCMGISHYMQLYVNGEQACLIRRAPTYFKPMLMIHDSKGRPTLKIKGPSVGSDRKVFLLQTIEKHNIGSVDRNPALVPPGYIPFNHTVIKFPLDLDVRFKAAVIASSFLIVNSDTRKIREEKWQSAVMQQIIGNMYRED